eukprot:UN03254
MSIDPNDAKKLIDQHKQQEDKKKAEEKRHRLNLVAMLTPEARERLDRLALVNPEKASAVGDLIVAHASEGFISQRVTDDQMKEFMDIVNAKQSKGGKITIQRKRYQDSDDDDNDDDL